MNRRPQESRSSYDAFSAQRTRRFTAASPDSDFFEKKRRRSLPVRALTGLLIALLLTVTVNFALNFFVRVERVTVPVRGLCEAFDGFTILHLSDLKGARFGGEQGLFGFSLGDDKYDLVVMTGDMVSKKGNAQPLYELIDLLREKNAGAPIYMIAGDSDPLPASMIHAGGGSPFAPWVIGATQRGAQLLSSPQAIERDGQRIWIAASSQLSLDMDVMQRQYEQQYIEALAGGDENAIELAAYHLMSLEGLRAARAQMSVDDAYIALTHALPGVNDSGSLTPQSLPQAVDLMLGGHYLGGMIRIPGRGPLFVPSSSLPRYGILPEGDVYAGLSRRGTTWLYASPGLGSEDAMYPSWFFRLFNPPTATLITLTASSM